MSVHAFFSVAQAQADIDFSRLQHIGMEQGLSSNKVNCILQDKKGFMWIGTDYGLNRYDGYSFKVFLKDENDSLSLADNNITCLTQDSTGNVWIGTPKGLCVMEYNTEKIKPFKPLGISIDSLWKYNIEALAASDSSIWVGASWKGLFEVNVFNHKFKSYSKADNSADSIAEANVMCITYDGQKIIYAAVQGFGIIEINTVSKQSKLYSLDRKVIPDKPIESNNAVASIITDEMGNVFLGTVSSMIFELGESKTIEVTQKMKGNYYIRDGRESVFSSLKNGFTSQDTLFNGISMQTRISPSEILFKNSKDSVGIITYNPATSKISGCRWIKPFCMIGVTCFFNDISNNIWICNSKGIDIYNRKKSIVQLEETSGAEINSITEDELGNIWMGTDNKSILKYITGSGFVSVINSKEDLYKSISQVCSDKSGNIYSISKNVLLKYSRQLATLEPVMYLNNIQFGDFGTITTSSIFSTSNGEIWLNDTIGLGVINTLTNKVEYVLKNSNDSIFNFAMSFFYEANGCLYKISSKSNEKKIVKISLDNKQIKNYVTKEKIADWIYKFIVDPHEVIWFGTYGNGIGSYNLKTEEKHHYSIMDGLPSQDVGTLVPYDAKIWCTYRDGIYSIETGTNLSGAGIKIHKYSIKNGLPDIDYSSRTGIKSRNGRILFATKAHLVSFYPDSIKSNDFIPPIVLTKLQVNNRTVEAGDSMGILLNNITSTDTLNLNYTQTNLSFEFASLNYTRPEENEYAYKLIGEGNDTSWVYCGKRRFVNFSNLAPGEYTFHVKGSNNDGLWNEQGTQLKIFITPPYWQTGWFRFSSLAGFGLLLFGTYRWRVRNLRKEKIKLEKTVAERTEEISLEKQKSEELLLNILPAEVMEELKQTGKTQARNYDLVTVLFADFKDFTQIIDELPPEELVSGIDNYFETFDTIIGKHSIEKIKTVGDAYICVAGLPQTTSNNPLVMMDVALEMVTAIEQLKQERTAAGKIIFDVRIGIHSGPVVAGVVGIKKFAYDIWGDTVNTAARMQQHGEPGKINISGTTRDLIKHRFHCTQRGRIEVKHKGFVDMYFVDGRK